MMNFYARFFTGIMITGILSTVPVAVRGMECYVCKTSLPAYDSPVNCPNVNNPGTTTKQECPSGMCLTFRGSQQRNTNVIEDGVVRLCSSGENVRKIFGTATLSIDSPTAESCRQVAYSSSSNIHDNTAINGRVCTCNSNLCNSQFQSNSGDRHHPLAVVPSFFLLTALTAFCYAR